MRNSTGLLALSHSNSRPTVSKCSLYLFDSFGCLLKAGFYGSIYSVWILVPQTLRKCFPVVWSTRKLPCLSVKTLAYEFMCMMSKCMALCKNTWLLLRLYIRVHVQFFYVRICISKLTMAPGRRTWPHVALHSSASLDIYLAPVYFLFAIDAL